MASKIPEPSPRMVIWLAAVTTAMLCGILVFDYTIGDPRMAWNKRPHDGPTSGLQKIWLNAKRAAASIERHSTAAKFGKPG